MRGRATLCGRVDGNVSWAANIYFFHPAVRLWHTTSVGFFCASICYLESDTGSVLDLKWHFLPFQGDLSGVERSCGEWKRRTGGWMNGVDDGASLKQRTESTFALSRMRDKRVETHRCLLHSPQWTSWSETWRSELKGEDDISASVPKNLGKICVKLPSCSQLTYISRVYLTCVAGIFLFRATLFLF